MLDILFLPSPDICKYFYKSIYIIGSTTEADSAKRGDLLRGMVILICGTLDSLTIKVSNQQGFKTHNRYTAASKVINRAQPDWISGKRIEEHKQKW